MAVDVLDREDSVEETAPITYRNSYKYRVEPQHTVLVMDFVFAHDLDQAEERARTTFSLDPEERVHIYRISEGSMGGQRIA